MYIHTYICMYVSHYSIAQLESCGYNSICMVVHVHRCVRVRAYVCACVCVRVCVLYSVMKGHCFCTGIRLCPFLATQRFSRESRFPGSDGGGCGLGGSLLQPGGREGAGSSPDE